MVEEPGNSERLQPSSDDLQPTNTCVPSGKESQAISTHARLTNGCAESVLGTQQEHRLNGKGVFGWRWPPTY